MSGDNRLELVRFLDAQRRMMQTYAYAMVNDHHVADDVVQEVSLLLAQKWDEVESNPDRVRWLTGALRRKSLEAHRAKTRSGRLLSAEALSNVGATVDVERESKVKLFDSLSACLNKLPQTMRTVILSRYRDEEDCSKIARRLKRPVSSIYTVLKRARQQLARCVALKHPDLGFPGDAK